MALTRKMLKEMGIQEDNIEKIIMAHSETVDALKKFKTDSERLASVEEEQKASCLRTTSQSMRSLKTALIHTGSESRLMP